MVCTFGDKQDVVWMYRHKLDYVQAMDEYGKLTNANEFSGLKLSDAKEKILEKFKNEKKLISSRQISQVVKVHDRCKTPIELANSYQWFAKITQSRDRIKECARTMKWHPDFAISHLDNWADFVEWDWVISRQRTFGTPIPFWVCSKCGEVIKATQSELPVYPAGKIKKCPRCASDANGETSVFDCWVDSSITPLVIAKWEEDEEFFARAYPANLRPQGVEIVRTWAFYTIYRCQELSGKAPFVELLLNGNVLAPDGKKMSKSLGNIIEPDKLIEENGADSVRVWASLSGAMAKDRPFSMQDILFAKSFLHKFLNGAKFVQSALEGYSYSDEHINNLREIDKYFLFRLNTLICECNSHWKIYEFHHIMHKVQEFFWHEFCDYYLEYVKSRIYSQTDTSRSGAQFVLHTVYSNVVLLLTPFIPHACEEVWQIFKKDENKTVMFESYPKENTQFDFANSARSGELLADIVSKVRQKKASAKLALNYQIDVLSLRVEQSDINLISLLTSEILSVCCAKSLDVSLSDVLEVDW